MDLWCAPSDILIPSHANRSTKVNIEPKSVYICMYYTRKDTLSPFVGRESFLNYIQVPRICSDTRQEKNTAKKNTIVDVEFRRGRLLSRFFDRVNWNLLPIRIPGTFGWDSLCRPFRVIRRGRTPIEEIENEARARNTVKEKMSTSGLAFRPPLWLSFTIDFVVWTPAVELASRDCDESFQPPLALRELMRELVYSFESGTLKIKCLYSHQWEYNWRILTKVLTFHSYRRGKVSDQWWLR